MGGASRLWLHHSLRSLNSALNGQLQVFRGDACEIIPRLISISGARSIHWNRCYEPWRIARDKKIRKQLLDSGVEAQSYNGSLLWEPGNILKQDGQPYQVFTCLLYTSPSPRDCQ